MEVYAAMVESMDRDVGRILNALERAGVQDQTLVTFFRITEAARPDWMIFLQSLVLLNWLVPSPAFVRQATVGVGRRTPPSGDSRDGLTKEESPRH